MHLHNIEQALEYIHARGVVHLDVKPANVFIGDGGALKLGDFGVAQRVGATASDCEGDALYIAPELLVDAELRAPCM